MNSKTDKIIGLIFGLLTVVFIVIFLTNDQFRFWAFERHHNQISWYIRPLFLIPFCIFSYKRSYAGVMGSVFLLLTSMFWFPKPDAVDPMVVEFLNFEKEWLGGYWNLAKILMALLIPLTMFALSYAFWKRNIYFGLTVIIAIALGKVFWSLAYGGESGRSIVLVAIIGLVVCVGVIFLGIRKSRKVKNE